jgi:hypothetical protein
LRAEKLKKTNADQINAVDLIALTTAEKCRKGWYENYSPLEDGLTAALFSAAGFTSEE